MIQIVIRVGALGSKPNAAIGGVSLVVIEDGNVIQIKNFKLNLATQASRVIDPVWMQWWLEQDTASNPISDGAELPWNDAIDEIKSMLDEHPYAHIFTTKQEARQLRDAFGHDVDSVNIETLLRRIGLEAMIVYPDGVSCRLAAEADAATLSSLYALRQSHGNQA